MKVTIYQVAEKANVSIATVSKVINNTGRIGEDTKKRVLKAMEELNYYPSLVASALTGKKTDTIGLLLPDISNPFFAEIARHIEDRAHELGLSVIMCSTDYNKDKESKYIQLLLRKQVDGFILSSGFRNKDLLNRLVEDEIPLAMIAHYNPSISVHGVSIDDYKGGYLATSHLLSLGHKNIGLIGENVRSSNLRIYGYRDAFQDYDLSVDEGNILLTDASVSNGRKCAEQLLTSNDKPSAIFAVNDLLAIGAFQVAQEKGLSIPSDLSIISFDNTILSRTTVPPLTTVAQPIEEMGKKIVDLLLEEIQHPKNKNEQLLYSPELIIRGST
ncbi:LacI family transcriptional regulator [Bacillus shivajii]|uniref:LacI family DNA-binding transcriptional regulator n=1 Tax=Bacillus shivajii TaxID=1983719 RepID=UPI001CFA9F96|nr:LacI family DNA-binding transcriptional regulator [Bacillus shivajii]UCZ52808.1 LacI family transcriptional regulator [Bacillus shivajii]